MNIRKNIKTVITYSTQVAAAGLVLLSRFFHIAANLSPLGSFGFFGQQWWLYAAIIVIHDWLKGGFYSGFWMTYIGFAGYVLLGRWSRKNLKKQLIALPVASWSFFLFSNAGVWWYWYPHTIQGLTQCFILAIPFFKNTILGDLVFGYGYLAANYLYHNKNYVASKLNAIRNKSEISTIFNHNN